MPKRKKGSKRQAASTLRTGPDGGKYRLVKWYPKKKTRRQKETLFGENWHRPSLLKDFMAGSKPKKRRRR